MGLDNLEQELIINLEPQLFDLIEYLALEESWSDKEPMRLKISERYITLEEMTDHIRYNTEYAAECLDVAYALYLTRLKGNRKD